MQEVTSVPFAIKYKKDNGVYALANRAPSPVKAMLVVEAA